MNIVIVAGIVLGLLLAFSVYLFYELGSYLVDAPNIIQGYSTKTEVVVNEELEKACEEFEKQIQESGTNSNTFYKSAL